MNFFCSPRPLTSNQVSLELIRPGLTSMEVRLVKMNLMRYIRWEFSCENKRNACVKHDITTIKDQEHSLRWNHKTVLEFAKKNNGCPSSSLHYTSTPRSYTLWEPMMVRPIVETEETCWNGNNQDLNRNNVTYHEYPPESPRVKTQPNRFIDCGTWT